MMEPALLGTVLLWAAVGSAALSLVTRLDRLSGLAATLSAGSVVVLAWALLANDFSMAYVVKTSSLATPWPYRLGALWGGMEGSMLFYASMTVVVSYLGLRHRRVAGLVANLVGFALLLFTASLVSPFAVLDIPAVDGEGLLALLQHPAMIYHPPILYLGLTTLVIPFALTVEGVVTGSLGRSWLGLTRRWLLVSWTLLTLGMVAGANWAYVELGWGGYWAWDPVENTALMPWMAATVFLHASRLAQRDRRMIRWSVVFATLPFALTVLGVYLTRSGSTGSIHSFAEDPVIGQILLVAAGLTVAVVAALAARTPKGEAWERFGFGRDSWLGASALLVTASLIFVVVGSAYPAYSLVFLGDDLAVGSGFFASTLYPFALALAVLSGLAFNSRWAGNGLRAIDATVYVASAGAIAGTAFVLSGSRAAPIALLSLAGGAVVALLRSVVHSRPTGRVLAGHIAHLGLVMVLVGAAGSSLGAEFIGEMAPGDGVEIGGKTVTLEGIETGDAGRFIFVRARFDVGGEEMTPEIRAYENQRLPVAEPDLLSGPAGDVVVAISTVTPDASSVDVAVFVRPMVWWVWAGSLTIALAGLVSLGAIGGGASARHRLATEGRQSAGRASGTFVP